MTADTLILTVGGLMLIRPTNHLIYRVCRASTP